jgi:hypothetical protein
MGLDWSCSRLSAHSAMRLTGVLALLLWAASTSIGTQAGAAEAHGKAVASTRTGSHKSTLQKRTNAKAGSKTAARAQTGVPARRAGISATQGKRGSRLRATSRATVRNVRYTLQRRPVTTAAVESGPDFAAGYQQGYQAGLAAARKQLERDSSAGTLTERSMTPDDADRSLPAIRESGTPRRSSTSAATGQTEAKKALRTLTLDETTETEIPETPQIDQVATLHVGGAGMPGPLRGSLASLERQNDRVEADGLERILDEADLDSRIAHKLLVPVPASAALKVNPNLSENHRYCRPWTAHFLADLARAHQAAFHKPIQVNSAVRTVEYQKRLMNTNGNAAAAEGDVVSPHLTGATIDIGKQGLSRKELGWMRRQLLALQNAGKIDVEEEFAQACFHITVYKDYGVIPPQRRGAQSGPSRATTTPHKAGKPAPEMPSSSLPRDLAVGVFGSKGR